MKAQQGFLILDFGSQYTQLIARRFRELGYYTEVAPFWISLEEIKKKSPFGIILSGGPNSVYNPRAPKVSVLDLKEIAPLLGVCYGMQWIAHNLGGRVARAEQREYGQTTVYWKKPLTSSTALTLKGNRQSVWMSHGDVVEVLPEDFELLATSESGHPAAILGGKILAVQFHPEVAHTENGIEILKFFAQEICDCSPNWGSRQMLDYIYEQIQEQVGSQDHILCALSGGVDSTVASVLLTKLFGADRVHCVFVDNGLLRKDEFTTVLEHYKQLGLNVKGINASDKFLTALRGVVDPEIKRKKIGQLFIEVFDQTVREMGLDQVQFLAQGTLYPDVIESASPWGGPSVTIKSHHNVGGLPEKMKLKLVEPLRWLFKDEVRTLGRQLGIPEPFLQRHPFPGPGLGIRVVGEVTQDKLNILKDVDAIFTEELRKAGLYEQIWQAFAVLLPVRAVGVQGDERSYEWTAVLRAVTSVDGMTADWFSFGPEFMRKVSNRITNEVARVNRVLYDVTSKPPGTIEWE